MESSIPKLQNCHVSISPHTQSTLKRFNDSVALDHPHANAHELLETKRSTLVKLQRHAYEMQSTRSSIVIKPLSHLHYT